MVNRWSSLVEKISTLWPSGTGVLDILTRKRLSSSIFTVLICLHFCRFSLHFHIFNTFCLHFCRLLLPLESFASWIDVTLSSQQVAHRCSIFLQCLGCLVGWLCHLNQSSMNVNSFTRSMSVTFCNSDLNRGQFLPRRSGVSRWREVWHEMERHVLPSQHCPAALVRCASLWYKINSWCAYVTDALMSQMRWCHRCVDATDKLMSQTS